VVDVKVGTGTSRFFYVAEPTGAERNLGEENTHATVKTIVLMRYLCRLFTPLISTVLAPFLGPRYDGPGMRRLGVRVDRD
jgi:hypothetical protein